MQSLRLVHFCEFIRRCTSFVLVPIAVITNTGAGEATRAAGGNVTMDLSAASIAGVTCDFAAKVTLISGPLAELPPLVRIDPPQPHDVGTLLLLVHGEDGYGYRLESSADLTSWNSVVHFATSNGLARVIVPAVVGSSIQFFRVVTP